MAAWPNFADLDIVDACGHHHVVDSNVVAVAEQIVRLYQRMRPRYVPGEARITRKSLLHFYWAAQRCIQEKQTPEDYVSRQLEDMALAGCMWPQAIAADLRSKRTYQSSVGVLRAYHAQLAHVEERAAVFGAELAVRDATLSVGALVRCVLAHELGLKDVEQAYLEDARVELQALPLARQVFGEKASFLNV